MYRTCNHNGPGIHRIIMIYHPACSISYIISYSTTYGELAQKGTLLSTEAQIIQYKDQKLSQNNSLITEPSCFHFVPKKKKVVNYGGCMNTSTHTAHSCRLSGGRFRLVCIKGWVRRRCVTDGPSCSCSSSSWRAAGG